MPSSEAVLDKRIILDPKAKAVLEDCLFVMDCDEIWISDNKETEDDCTADEEDTSAQMINLVRKTFVSGVCLKIYFCFEHRAPLLFAHFFS